MTWLPDDTAIITSREYQEYVKTKSAKDDCSFRPEIQIHKYRQNFARQSFHVLRKDLSNICFDDMKSAGRL